MTRTHKKKMVRDRKKDSQTKCHIVASEDEGLDYKPRQANRDGKLILARRLDLFK